MNYKNLIFHNLANLITLLGIILAFVLLWETVFHRNQMVVIFLLVLAVLLTDLADGIVARYFNIISQLGAALDRLRDKIFQFTMFVFFVLDPRIDPWLKLAIYPLIVVEILLLTIWYLGVKKKLNVSAGIWGKAKMFLVSIGILACPAIIIAKEWGLGVPFFMVQVLFVFFLLSLCFGIMSFIKHLEKYRNQLQPL